jgi:hypothetical protein
MSMQMDKFSETLNPENYDKAIQIYAQVKKSGISDSDQLFKVHTKDCFKRGFEFPQISMNQYVQDQLTHLEAAQDNLNNNIKNKKLSNDFIAVGIEVAANLA